MKKLILCLALVGIHALCIAQFSQAARDSIARLSRLDHEQMKRQLGMTVPNRRGPSGNPNDPNAANADEAKVVNYALPDPLTLSNGKKVTSTKDWWEKRRPELLEAFDTEIYGRLPEKIPTVSPLRVSRRGL